MSKVNKYSWWLLVIVLMLVLQPVSDKVNYERLVYGLARPMPATRLVEKDFTVIPGVIAGAILGGFRGVAAAMLWMKADELWDSGHGTEIKYLSMLRATTLLDPHWIEPWRILGWHLAYNLYVEADKIPDEQARAKRKAEYMRMGINCLKEGISWNPNRYDLYFELGWTYYDKVRNYDEAAKWLRHAIQFKHPSYIERLIAHAYERKPDIPKALDWYDYCIKRNPADGTAYGATLTIHERYLRPWRLMEQGKYDEAIKELDYYLAVSPEDTLPLHLKAYIYERAGNLEKAYQWWSIAGKQPLNSHARERAARLARILGKPVPPEPTYIMRQQQEMAVPRPRF